MIRKDMQQVDLPEGPIGRFPLHEKEGRAVQQTVSASPKTSHSILKSPTYSDLPDHNELVLPYTREILS